MADFVSRLLAERELKWHEGDTGFLVDINFVNDLEISAKNGLPPGELDNSQLKKKNKWKPNMRQGVDYFVITEDLYDELEMEFGGGPKVTCGFDVLGNASLYTSSVSFTLEGIEKKFTVSKYAILVHFVPLLSTCFSTEDRPFTLFVAGSKPPTACSLSSQLCAFPGSAFEVVFDKPKVIREKRERPVKRSVETGRISGFKNIGNSCYMNASLQSFLCLSQFVEAAKILQGPLAEAFAGLVEGVEKGRAVWDPSSFKRILGRKIPCFDNTSQQDAHEFTSFFIDAMHEENRARLEEEFYGKLESATTCAQCKAVTNVEEPFTVLSVPVTGSRRIILSPWDLNENLQRIPVVPEFPVIVLSANDELDGVLLEVENVESCKEAYAFEMPSRFDEEENEGLAVVHVKCGDRDLCRPLLFRAPLNREVTTTDIEISVWNRVQLLWDSVENQRDARKFVKIVEAPKRFTTGANRFFCVERVVVSITGNRGEASFGFRSIRTHVVSPVVSVDELLHVFFSQGQLDVSNKWKCGHCGKETCAFHQFAIDSAPNNIIIQLKRFTRGNRFQRDNTVVKVPTTIDLTQMMKLQTSGVVRYDLRAVTNHMGSLDSGHYTATGRRSDCWYLFNDSNVQPRSGPPEQSDAPYLLFFTRVK